VGSAGREKILSQEFQICGLKKLTVLFGGGLRSYKL
jgi:hypothetical protein